ncbi:MAG: phosphatase domain-containing protein [Rhodanobacter sp.]
MIIFDLDGTLADCEHRRHFVDADKNKEYEYSTFEKDPITREVTCGLNSRYRRKDNWDIIWKPDWKSFYEACDQDKPIEPVCEIFRQLHLKFPEDSNEIHIWSGRCESTRKDTDIWLTHNLHPTKNWFHYLKMRPVGDYTPDDLLKERWLNERCADLITAQIEDRMAIRHDIDFVFASDPKSIEMWRGRGIFVFDVNQSGKEF